MSHPYPLDRRKFLKLGMMTTGAALGRGAPVAEVSGEEPAGAGMRHRALGKTGLRVSEVSFGSHGLDNPALMEAAIEAGITTFATSGKYLDGREEEALGQVMQAVGKPREELVLLTGNVVRPGESRQQIMNDVDGCLRRLRTDHIDIYCVSDVCSPSDLRIDAMLTAMDEAKKAGKIGHLALSGHCGGMQPCLEAAIEDGRFEVFFVKYDFVSYPDQDAILRRAQEKGIGTIVFKTNAGGRESEIKDLEAGGLSFRQATVKWALTNPYVSSVCLTMGNFGEIRDFATVAGSPLSRPEWEMLNRYAEKVYDRYCRFCRTCEGRCPHQVAVADVMRYEMYFTSYGREKEAMSLYASLPQDRTARACLDCAGSCEGSCPFGRRIREGLREAHATLSFA